MKRLRELLVGAVALFVIAPVTLAGCSETTKVEEKVMVEDDTPAVEAVTAPQDDVNVNVQVEGNTAPQPVIIEKKEIVHETTNVVRNEPVQPVVVPEKKVEVHNHITNVNPPAPTENTDPVVTTNTTTTTDTQ